MVFPLHFFFSGDFLRAFSGTSFAPLEFSPPHKNNNNKDAVCNDYHENPAGDKVHTINWSLAGVEGLPDDGQLDLSKLGLKDELSMRVRVGRNLASFPLPGAMTKVDRINFEKTMLKAFDVLKADPKYGGTVYSMTPDADWKEITGQGANPNLMSDAKYKELVKAHVMFKDMDADPYLKSAGIAS